MIKAAMFLLLAISVFLAVILPKSGGRYEVNAASGDAIAIKKLHAEYTVNTDRTVDVVENITVTFLQSGLSMFYHSLPKENTRYTNVSATCAGNDAFSFYVADNPDMSDFLDINCTGGTQRGKTLEYQICYTMQSFDVNNSNDNGMIIDLVGFGSSVAIHNVQVKVNFPANSKLSYTVYSGAYGSESNRANVQVSKLDATTLMLTADTLNRVYQSQFGEYMAEGITLQFTLGDGVLKSQASAKWFTEIGWVLALVCGGGALLGALLAILLPKREEIVTTVNVRAPDEMDPMTMGKRLDGIVDNEDVTSMLYYFADKGYLHIDLTDEDDPLLIRRRKELPDSEPVHARTLFNGLFKNAEEKIVKKVETPFDEDEVECSIHTSQLKYKFFESVNTAKEQLVKIPQYAPKSIVFYVLGGILGLLLGFLVPFIAGVMTLGSTYTYCVGVMYVVGVLGVLLIGYLKENYRYKWKKGTKLALLFVQFFIAALISILFIFGFASHLMTRTEKLLLSIAVFVCTFATNNKLDRTQQKKQMLGDILGFKDFIVYTEEDKIKTMLRENPQLYYKILPYAQVLGVTDEWEDKFKNITIEAPTWCAYSHGSYFDYLIFRSCMRRAMITAMTPPQAKGGTHIGRGGGGGSFGGFGGGGFGGGGFGAR